MDEINRVAEKNVQIDKDTAEKNADTNDTSYKTEFEAILSSHGCEDEEELKEYYVFEEQQAKFKENFYKIYADENNTKWNGFNLLRDGSASANETDAEKKYSGYLETKVPYHISHILVNVEDGASNNYWNGTISSENVEHLKRVVDGLMDVDKSFGTVASEESDDGSKSSFGDLGIVDKDKATEESDKFVKEFILGLYTYDNVYNPDATVHARVASSNIAPSDSILTGLPEKPSYISYKVFKELYDAREIDGNSSLVIGTSSANFYPRNIIYNHELNNHGVSLIVDPDATVDTGNFKMMTIKGESKAVLCARGTSNPILVTRAGASYQGIHFIVVNRSPFEGSVDSGDLDLMRNYKVNDVKLSEYYTTKYPGQTGYPADRGGKTCQTYVNTIDSLTSKYKERAEKVAEEIKTFDTNIERVIYEKYMNGKLEFTDAGKEIESTINAWIARSRQEKSNSTFDSWEEYWGDYIDMLDMQTEQASKKLKKGCGIAFSLAAKAKTKTELDGIKFNYENGVSGTENTELVALGVTASTTFDQIFNEIGGACNDGETHK